MSRTYRLLGLALALVGALALVVQLVGGKGATTVPAATTAAPNDLMPAMSQPGTSAPGTSRPVASQPVASQPGTSAPVATSVSTTVAPSPMQATDADCPSTAHGAIVDRARQAGALCDGGRVAYRFPITSARAQPDPGTYPVYAKDMTTSSTFGGHVSTMTHFVAFTRGENTGARVAFHSVPKLLNGDWVQPLDSVGTEEYHGASSGCIRVLPDDAVRIWDWLGMGDEVHVIS
jgi:hypothetical protein